MKLPHLTPDFPGIGGALKERPEDFFVQELPLYEPSGEGEHVYCEIQKIGLTTFDLVFSLTGGGPGTATTVIGYFIWSETFKMLSYGRGAALAVILALTFFYFTVAFGLGAAITKIKPV